MVRRKTETYCPAAYPQRAPALDRHTVSVYQETGGPAAQRTQPRQQTQTAACGCWPCAWRQSSRQQASHDHPCSAPSNGSKDTQRQSPAAASSPSRSSLLPQQQQPPPPAAAATSSPGSSRLLPQQQGCRRGSRQTTVGTAGSAARNLPSPKATRPCGARTCIQTDSGEGRRSHDPPVLPVERKEAGTRATEREHSITLAAPVGDEADSPDQVLASTLLGAKGGSGPQRSQAARRHEAPSEPRPTASKRRPVRPPRSRGPRARRDGSHSVNRHADSE